MAIVVPIEVNVFNALFFFLHEFLFLAAIHFLLEAFVNRKTREKLSRGQAVSLKNTGFFHIYNTTIRTWAGVVALILMTSIWLSVPFTELGISSTQKFETSTQPLVHLKFGEPSSIAQPTFSEVIDTPTQDPEDSRPFAFYKLNPFFYSLSKCTISVLTDVGENIGTTYFDFYLDPVPAAPNTIGADKFNEKIRRASSAPPETACRNGLGGRDERRLAKIYQVPVPRFDTIRLSSTIDANDDTLVTGAWNSTHNIHTFVTSIDGSPLGGVCLLDDRNRSVLLSTETATIRATRESSAGEGDPVQIEIRPGVQNLGYRISTSIDRKLVCEELGRQVPESLLNSADEIFGRFGYPLSSLEIADAITTVDQKVATQVELWALFVYFVPLILAFAVCSIGILASDPSADNISKEVTGYSGLAKMLKWHYTSKNDNSLNMNPSRSTLELEKTMPIEVQEEGEELYLAQAPVPSPVAEWERQGQQVP